MEEIWVEILGYEGKYMVSNIGNVSSMNRKIRSSRGNSVCNLKAQKIKSHPNQKGYFSVLLYNNGIGKRHWLHRLVAQAFISNTENKATVNHKDGNKANNCVDNLEWATQSENNTHSYDVLNRSRAKKKGADSHVSKPVSVYNKKNELIGEYVSIKDSAIKLGYSSTFMGFLLNGQRKSNKIYVKYTNNEK